MRCHYSRPSTVADMKADLHNRVLVISDQNFSLEVFQILFVTNLTVALLPNVEQVSCNHRGTGRGCVPRISSRVAC